VGKGMVVRIIFFSIILFIGSLLLIP